MKKNYLPKRVMRNYYVPKILFLLLIFLTFLSNNKVVAQNRGNKSTTDDGTGSVTVHGRITSDKGEPLIGASVHVKGTTAGVATDAEGGFTLHVAPNAVLVVTYASYEKREIAVEGRSVINVQLKGIESQLGEVVVTALGIKRQERNLGYSTTQIAGATLTDSRTPNLANALSGQVAGVSVEGTGTGPNGSTRILIRGNTSFTGNSQPLYILDGVPFESSQQGQSGMWGGADQGDPLSTINPDDIESVNVLKGVAASALYGYRAGNGAIIITTKSGTNKKGIGLEINNNTTITSVIDYRDWQTTYGQGSLGIKPTTEVNFQANATSSWGARIDGSPVIDRTGNMVPYSLVNNYKFYNTGVTSVTTVSLNGNNENGHFRLGVFNSNAAEIIPFASSQSQGVNYNSAYNLSPKLHLNFSANYTYEKVNNRPWYSDAPGSSIATVNQLATTYDIRSLRGNKGADPATGLEYLPAQTDPYFDNPYWITQRQKNITSRNRYTGAVTLKYDLFKWVSVQGQVNENRFTNDNSAIQPTGTAWSQAGSYNVATNTDRELNTSVLVDINKKWNSFTLHADIGANHQDDFSINSSTGGGISIPNIYNVANLAAGNRTYNGGTSEYKVNSVFAAVDLGFRNWLFLTATGREDWFSVLNPQTNHLLYPSVVGSFVFSDAWKMPDWISFGKLRASYAKSTGNLPGPYSNILTYTPNVIPAYGVTFLNVNQSTVPNAFLKPNSVAETEIGFNIAFLNGRLSLDAAGYNKVTTNDILSVSTDNASGYTGTIENIGQLRNRGLELLIQGYPVRTTHFSWKTSLNFATNSSKTIYLSPGVNSITVDAPARFGTISIQDIVGKQLGQIVGYKYKRDAKGNIIYDATGLPEHGDNTEPLGSGIYRVTGGFSNEFHYKNFFLSGLIDYKFGAKIFSVSNSIYYANGVSKTTLQGREGAGYVGKGVTESGAPNTLAVPAQTYWSGISAAGSGTNEIDEEFTYNASFIKLRNVSLGYSVPESALRKSFIKGITVTAVGRNMLMIWKKTPNIDPESNLLSTVGQGVEYNAYPPFRTYGLNINLKF